MRDALAKKEGDTDNTTLLKETLTAVDKQYSLIRKGQIQVNYELGYTYIGQEKINTDLSSGLATLFSIQNSNSHTVTNTVMLDYGVRNNLTANVSMPFISRYADSTGYSGVSHTLGDLGLNVRWQPHRGQARRAHLHHHRRRAPGHRREPVQGRQRQRPGHRLRRQHLQPGRQRDPHRRSGRAVRLRQRRLRPEGQAPATSSCTARPCAK